MDCRLLFFYTFLLYFVKIIRCVTLKKECPGGEVHKSCAFRTEYTCWTSRDRVQRVQDIPRRLSHCQSGCYCKAGLVREYPAGPCIAAAGCRDRKIEAFLKNLPTFDGYTGFET
ncbi:uncharacterized protein LOC142979571 [Anticarsia gemmatalis]|uniref:uncharacterized protein LOC142979571 n=1 Tax=Anticarsia gemmatalis TaxID=129554 RepID=UPI003F76CFE2